MTTKPRGHRLKLLRDLSDTDLNKQIEVAGLQGTLTGVIPRGDRVQLALIVGRARAYTAALAGDEVCEIWREAAS